MACDWRKLPVRLSPDLEAAPCLARGLAAELRRHAADDGRITAIPRHLPATMHAAAEEVAFVLRARPSEVAAVVDALELLFDIGEIELEERTVFLCGFEAEQQKRSPAAERKRRQREREAAAAARAPAASGVPTSVTVTSIPRDVSRGVTAHPGHEFDPAEGEEASCDAVTPISAEVTEGHSEARDSHAEDSGQVTQSPVTVPTTRLDETRLKEEKESSARDPGGVVHLVAPRTVLEALCADLIGARGRGPKSYPPGHPNWTQSSDEERRKLVAELARLSRILVDQTGCDELTAARKCADAYDELRRRSTPNKPAWRSDALERHTATILEIAGGAQAPLDALPFAAERPRRPAGRGVHPAETFKETRRA